jgi:DNA helicase IV
VHHAAEETRDRAERAPDTAADRFAARSARQDMLERFREPVDLDALCFGRIDLERGCTYYVGRGAVHENAELLVVNWRMLPVAPFYTGNRQDPQGLERRRRFQLDQVRLLGIVEHLFGEAPPPTIERPEAEPKPIEEQIEPHVVDAILADMDGARTTEMRDIVATIEARQYELMSDSIDGLLVIQGGPGSGKTAIGTPPGGMAALQPPGRARAFRRAATFGRRPSLGS